MKPRSDEGEKRRIDALRIALKTPEHRQKQRDAWKDPEFRKKCDRSGIKHTPESRAKMSIVQKEIASREDIKEKRKKIFNDPEFKKKIGELSKLAWEKPGARKERAEKLREVWSKPEIKEKLSGEKSNFWRGGRPGAYAKGWPVMARKIRARDDGLCQHPSCYIPSLNKLHHVHHIDFNKSNNDQSNLITLCQGHHIATKFGDTEYWIEFYQEIQRQRGLGSAGF